jgi:LPS-assembly lipoprotein
MWWHDHRSTVARFAGLASVLALSTLLAGCFEPLYGEKTLAGGPGLRDRLSTVSVDRIAAPSGSPAARIAVELQNDLIFNFTGGAGQPVKTHQLNVRLVTQNQQIIVDITTARADVQQFGINATFTLVETASGKPVLTGQAFARVSYDNPGQQQRFANARGQRDAENRAAKVISDNIKSRLASYFAAGA